MNTKQLSESKPWLCISMSENVNNENKYATKQLIKNQNYRLCIKQMKNGHCSVIILDIVQWRDVLRCNKNVSFGMFFQKTFM